MGHCMASVCNNAAFTLPLQMASPRQMGPAKISLSRRNYGLQLQHIPMSSSFSLGKVTLIYNVWNVSEAERDQNIHVI